MKLFSLLVSSLMFLSLQTLASAQITIIGADTSNTGENGSGGLLAAGSVDPAWQFVSYDNSYGFNNIQYAPTGMGTINAIPSPTTSTGSSGVVTSEAAYVVQNPPGAWAAATANSQFISANPNQSNGGMPGVYIYQFSFTSPVTGVVTLSGTASADNGLAIVYNGTTEATFGGQLVLSTTPGWTTSTNANSPTGGSVFGTAAAPFSFSAPITAGSNTLDFYVSNFNDAAYSGDEEGLDVTDFAITVVPEPKAYALYFLGACMGLLLFKRGRRYLRRQP